jgi:hypothetical protein
MVTHLFSKGELKDPSASGNPWRKGAVELGGELINKQIQLTQHVAANLAVLGEGWRKAGILGSV